MTCRACTEVIECPESDIAPSEGYFATQPFSILVDCPAGYYCFPGEFPTIITIPPNQIPVVTIDTGGNGSNACILGCLSMLCLPIPDGATVPQKQAIANQLFLLWAQQQAFCDSIVGRRKKPLTLPSACFETMYSYRLTSATGGITQSATVIAGFLPPGMFLQGEPNGPIYITGTPTQDGSYSFTIQATVNFSTTTQGYLLNVTKITVTPPGTADDVLADGTVGVPYTATLQAPTFAVPPLSWQVVDGALPPGLALDETTGIISGTPTGDSASYHFTILLQEQAT